MKHLTKILVCIAMVVLCSLPVYADENPTYTVTYLGYEGIKLDEQIVESVEDICYPEAPDVEGLVFSGWSISKEEIVLDKDLIIEALYTYPVSLLGDNDVTVTLEIPEIGYSNAIVGTVDSTITVSEFIEQFGNIEVGDLVTTGYYLTGITNGSDEVTTDMTATGTADNKVTVSFYINDSKFKDVEYNYEDVLGEIALTPQELISMQPTDLSSLFTVNGWLLNGTSVDSTTQVTPDTNAMRLDADVENVDSLTYSDDNTEFTVSTDGTLRLVKCNKSSYPIWSVFKSSVLNLVIEDTVSALPESGFREFSKITDITIPEGITEIPAYCFYGCSSAETLSLPESLLKVKQGALCGSIFNSITIPENVEEIWEDSFSFYDKKLGNCKEINILSKQLTVLPEYRRYCVFVGLSDQDGIIPNVFINTTTIPSGLFGNSTYNLELGTGVTTINPYCFGNYGFYASVKTYTWNPNPNVPYCYDLNTRWEVNSAFRDNSNRHSYQYGNKLCNIKISDNVKKIGEAAFFYCNHDSTLYTSNIDVSSVNFVGDYAFWGSSLFDGKTLPEDILYIGNWSFYDEELISIIIPECCQYIGNGAFFNCGPSDSSEYIPIKFLNSKPLDIGEMSFSDIRMSDLDLGDNIRNICPLAFSYCYIKSNVLNIDCETIQHHAFEHLHHAKDFDLTLDVKSIETSAFYAMYWDEKTDWSIPYNVTLTFGDSVETIGMNSFGGGNKFSELNWGSNIKTVKDSAFINAELPSITLPDSIEYIGDFAFWEVKGNYNEGKLPANVKHIGRHAFVDAFRIQSSVPVSQIPIITIPESIEYIGECAFAYTGMPLEINMSDNCTYVGKWAFYDSQVVSWTWSNQIDTIPEGCFLDCWKYVDASPEQNTANVFEFYDLVIPESVKHIGDAAFANARIATVDLGNVETIGRIAFADSLHKPYYGHKYTLELPATLRSIGRQAFCYCTGITDIKFNSAPTLDASAFDMQGTMGIGYVPERFPPVDSNPYVWTRDTNGLADLSSLDSSLDWHGKIWAFTTSNYEDYYADSWKDFAYHADRWPITIKYVANYLGTDIPNDKLTPLFKQGSAKLATIRYIDDAAGVSSEVLGWRDKNGTTYRAKNTYNVNIFESLVDENKQVVLYSDTWKPIEFEVSFDSKAGTSVSSQLVGYKEKASIPTPPTKTYFVFDKWLLNDTEYDFDSPVISDLTLTASWTPEIYTVSFDSDGGSEIEPQRVAYLSNLNPYPIPVKEGYTFDTWKYFNDSRWHNFTEDSYPYKDVTLKAFYTINKYDVVFHHQDDTTADVVQQVEYNSSPLTIAPATREHYTFGGWYKEESCTNAFDFSTPIKQNTDLYAKWIPDNQTVSFVTNGGTTCADETVPYGTSFTLPVSQKQYHSFEGWYEDAELTVPFTNDSVVLGDMTLYADWTPLPVEVQYIFYDKGTGEESVAGVSNVVYGTQVPRYTVDLLQSSGNPLVDSIAKEQIQLRQKFGAYENWYTDKVGTTAWDFTASVTGPMKLYTLPEYSTFIATFDSDGGTSVPDATIAYPGNVPEPNPSPTKEGYDFAGWFIDDASSDRNGERFNFDTDSVASDINFKAHWSTQVHTVKFVTNCEAEMSDISVAHGDKLPTPNLKNAHYKLAGMATNASGYPMWNFDDPVLSDMTLYAVWTPEIYTVKFDSHGGSKVKSQEVEYLGLVERPDDPTWDKHTFEGWYVDSKAKQSYDFNSDVTQNLVLHARWTDNSPKKEEKEKTDIKQESQESKSESKTPTMKTEAKNQDGSKVLFTGSKVTVIDTVTWDGGTVSGHTYTLAGSLRNKTTGEVFKDKEGNPVQTSLTVTPTSDSGTATVTFTFEVPIGAEGVDLVVFEELRDSNGNVIVSHNNLSSSEQTVYIKKAVKAQTGVFVF